MLLEQHLQTNVMMVTMLDQTFFVGSIRLHERVLFDDEAVVEKRIVNCELSYNIVDRPHHLPDIVRDQALFGKKLICLSSLIFLLV